MRKKPKKVPQSLYHYTTTSGLLGILKGKIWATHINYLNDKKEFIDAMGMFTTQIKEHNPNALALIGSERPGWGSIKHLPSDIYYDVVKVLEVLGGMVYVTAFSEYAMRDQLSQWRGYCAAGAGFSIGFNLAKFKELAKRVKDKHGTLKKCIYDPKAKTRQIEEIIKGAHSEKMRSVSAFSDMIAKMVAIAPYCKDESFREENEWRLAFIERENALFREGDTLIIPYVEFDLKDDNGRLPIENIVIGPSPNMSESYSSLELLLDQYGIAANIEESKIPYRPGL